MHLGQRDHRRIDIGGRAVAQQGLEGALHGTGRRQHADGRIDGDVEAERGQLVRRHDGGLAAVHHVGQQRLVESLADPRDLGLALRRLDEDHVGAGLGKGMAAGECLIEAKARACIGAGNDEEVGIASRLRGDPDLLHHVLDGDDAAPRRMPALLGHLLVFELDRAAAGVFVALHRVADVEEAAEARIRVADQR